MKNYVVGVDVGGTTVKMGLFDKEGNVLEKWELKTRTENGGENILPDIAKSIQEKLAQKKIDKEEVTGVGLGAPGAIDAEGVVHGAVNLGWRTFSIPDTLSGLLGLPVKAGNDANVAALGEMWKGGGQGCKNLVAVTLGTGVGGGIIVNGAMLTGAIGAGGEIGHIHVEDNEEEACGCTKNSCIISQCSKSQSGIFTTTEHCFFKIGSDIIKENLTCFGNTTTDNDYLRIYNSCNHAQCLSQIFSKLLCYLDSQCIPCLYCIKNSLGRQLFHRNIP